MKKIAFLLLAVITMLACKQGPAALVEKVYVVNIIDGDKPLQDYLHYHEQVWPEVEAGFKKAGYKDITIYHYNHLLVMIAHVPESADLNAMGKIAESYSPRCAEWNKLMSTYQAGVPGTKPGQTWVEAKSFYHFSN
jgi:L-rhamnose mutarotase